MNDDSFLEEFTVEVNEILDEAEDALLAFEKSQDKEECYKMSHYFTHQFFVKACNMKKFDITLGNTLNTYKHGPFKILSKTFESVILNEIFLKK